jgi:DNA-binding Xre family transcriptional regulator
MCQDIFIKKYAYLHFFICVCILSLNKEVMAMAQTIGRTIGAQVRALRAARGLTQDELAQAASVPQGNISRLERGEIHDVFVSTLLDLANALHVDAMALLQPQETTPSRLRTRKPTRQRPRKAAPVA